MKRISYSSMMGAAALLLVFLLPVPARADVENQTISAEVDDARIAKLVATGDRARRAHRNLEAFKAYSEAFQIRGDPAIAGRLGLVVMRFGDYAGAAEYLLHAITKAQAPPNLMREFHDAFANVRPKVCFVEVLVSEQGAEVLIDENQEPGSESSGFHVFVTAGSHTFQAKLAGFEDAITTIDIPAGGELQVRLNLKPLPPPPPPPPVQVEPMPNQNSVSRVLVKPYKSLSDSYFHFSVGAGLVFMLGATPGGALGPELTGGIRRGFFSINADARIAWMLTMLESAPDKHFMTWATGVRPCAHYAFLFGCGLLQVSARLPQG